MTKSIGQLTSGFISESSIDSPNQVPTRSWLQKHACDDDLIDVFGPKYLNVDAAVFTKFFLQIKTVLI